jgi:hypothetical protein
VALADLGGELPLRLAGGQLGGDQLGGPPPAPPSPTMVRRDER